MRVEVDRKLATDAILGYVRFKNLPWQADGLAVFSDHSYTIVLRGIKGTSLVLTDGQTEDSERHVISLSAATTKSEKKRYGAHRARACELSQGITSIAHSVVPATFHSLKAASLMQIENICSCRTYPHLLQLQLNFWIALIIAGYQNRCFKAQNQARESFE